MNLQITKIKGVILTREVITETTHDPVSLVIEKLSATVTTEKPQVNFTSIRTPQITQWSEWSSGLNPRD